MISTKLCGDMFDVQVQAEAAAKLVSMKARLKGASHTAHTAQQTQAQQHEQLSQLQSQLWRASQAEVKLQEQLETSCTAQKQLQAIVAQLEEEHCQLQQQLTESCEAAEKLLAKSTTHASELSTRNSDLTAQNSVLTTQIHQLQQQQSIDALELTACNSGLLTQLSLQQQQHAEATRRVTSEVTARLEKQLTVSQQQLKQATQRVQTAEQQLSAQLMSAAEAESRAARAEGLMKKIEERRAGLESDKRRLQTCVREVRAEVSNGKFAVVFRSFFSFIIHVCFPYGQICTVSSASL